jgi:hypothetical protein
MAASGNTMLSPFAGLVVMAALGGRVLSHKQQADVEHTYGDMSESFRERQCWLEAVLSKANSALSTSTPVLPDSVEPLVLFMGMVTQTTTLYLHEAITSKWQCINADDYSIQDTNRKSFAAAIEIARLAKMLKRLNCFTVSSPNDYMHQNLII